MLKELIVTPEIAGAIEAKGFVRSEVQDPVILNDGTKYWPAITLTLVQKWLRDTCGMFVDVQVDQTMEPKFCYALNKYTEGQGWENALHPFTTSEFLFYTYEEALHDGIVE